MAVRLINTIILKTDDLQNFQVFLFAINLNYNRNARRISLLYFAFFFSSYEASKKCDNKKNHWRKYGKSVSRFLCSRITNAYYVIMKSMVRHNSAKTHSYSATLLAYSK